MGLPPGADSPKSMPNCSTVMGSSAHSRAASSTRIISDSVIKLHGSLGRLICIAGIIGLIFFFSDAGWSSLAARRAHNPKVVGSNPAPATRIQDGSSAQALGPFLFWYAARKTHEIKTAATKTPATKTCAIRAPARTPATRAARQKPPPCLEGPTAARAIPPRRPATAGRRVYRNHILSRTYWPNSFQRRAFLMTHLLPAWRTRMSAHGPIYGFAGHYERKVSKPPWLGRTGIRSRVSIIFWVCLNPPEAQSARNGGIETGNVGELRRFALGERHERLQSRRRKY